MTNQWTTHFGRTRLSPRISLRLSNEEHAQLLKEAEALGVSLVQVVRIRMGFPGVEHPPLGVRSRAEAQKQQRGKTLRRQVADQNAHRTRKKST